MAVQPPTETLAGRRHVSFVLRLVVDASGQVVHGQIVDAGRGAATSFLGWEGLTRTLRARLDQGKGQKAKGKGTRGLRPLEGGTCL